MLPVDAARELVCARDCAREFALLARPPACHHHSTVGPPNPNPNPVITTALLAHSLVICPVLSFGLPCSLVITIAHYWVATDSLLAHSWSPLRRLECKHPGRYGEMCGGVGRCGEIGHHYNGRVLSVLHFVLLLREAFPFLNQAVSTIPWYSLNSEPSISMNEH